MTMKLSAIPKTMCAHKFFQQYYVPRSQLFLNLLLWLLFTLGSVIITILSEPLISKAECPNSCGSVTIPYPFGTSPECSYNESFLINCTSNSPAQPFFPHTNISILNISIPDGQLRVASFISRACYDSRGNLTNNSDSISYTSTNSIFPLSKRNKFAAVGCNTVGVVADTTSERYYGTGCVALCNKTTDVTNGSCSGLGCCQTSISERVFNIQTGVSAIIGINKTDADGFDDNPCSYAFVVEEDYYNFSSLDFVGFEKRKTVPLLLDWAVGDQKCIQARKNKGYACQASESECFDSANGLGYHCKCSPGYEGNPYLLHGCQDINECKRTPNPCINNSSACLNLRGNFSCSCPKGYDGDGRKDGTGCFVVDDRRDHSDLMLSIALGICIGLLVLIVGGSWIYWGLKKRKLIKLKEKFFLQNGGLVLQQQQHTNHTRSTTTAQIFTLDELKKATNNYHESRVLGQGGYGTVYKGELTDKKVVAIKKSKIGDQSQIEQFINEVIVLSQINHRNVVQLLGCCLEAEVPLLVYEFIINGTLAEHIHDKDRYSSLSWKMRLKIATETAEAIAYLHSSTSMPIIHRDIKTANILLDKNYTAKVSDFGASRLIPLDQTQLTTLVQGTLGYLDPEYFLTSQLTEKSDVYSFGVVLAELLTGQKVLSFDREECDRNLAMYFISSMKEGRLLQILDEHLTNETENIEQINEVAYIANSCLRVKGEERPTMKEVASQLEGLIRSKDAMHPWGQDQNHLISSEETEFLLKPSGTNLYEGNNSVTSSITTTGFDSTSIQIFKPNDDGDGR